MIYFFTIILGVAIFYVFNTLGKQAVILNIEDMDTLDIMGALGDVISIVSVFVAVILGFLIVYASAFLMKRRKKEFGVYMTLGMSKAKVALILVGETLVIGAISLVVGLLLGIAASQGMSVIVANLFEADMTNFTFVISNSAIVKTIIYFCIMYVVVMLLDIFIVGKTRLINLINAAKKSEKETNKNPIVCMIVLIAAIAILVSAYCNVTAGFYRITHIKYIGKEIAKGIVGTVMLFWSASGFVLLIAKARKKHYYSRLNAFTVREISSKINSTVVSVSIICILLFFSICIISTSFSVKKALDDNIKKLVPFNVMYETGFMDTDEKENQAIEKMLQSVDIDTSHLVDITRVDIHFIEEDGLIEAIKVSDYNKLAKHFDYETIELNDNEFAFAGNLKNGIKEVEEKLSNGYVLEANGKTYYPKSKKVLYGTINMETSEYYYPFFVVPDDFIFMANDKDYVNTVTFANYDTKDKKTIKEYDKLYVNEARKRLADDCHIIEYKTEIVNDSVGLSALFVFVGLYLGVIFIITSAAMLSLKLLSEAAQNKEKYDILRKIGADNNMINHSIFSQCAIYFGVPLFIAIIHSVFGIQTCTKIMSFFGKTGLLFSIIVTSLIFIAIYGGYGIITYFTSKKMLSE